MEPSLKVTFPVGVPAPGEFAVTTAVKVTNWPEVEGLSDEVKLVVVEAWLTVWPTNWEVLAGKVVSPLYCAVMARTPTLSAVLVHALRDYAAGTWRPRRNIT